MDGDVGRWERLEELFAAAVGLPPAGQAALVEREAASDPELGRQLMALLEHDRIAGTRIAQTVNGAAQAAAAPDWTGRRFGPYRVVREIGRGGMGLVFEAVRDDLEYRKTVALKIAPWWRDQDLLRERFREERQILAGLEHPNIARFLDGGTQDGVPYFAMEYVEGLPITEYTHRAGLKLREKIELFLQVCAALQFAHQNLVVHRDLKPSNILVTAEGAPKLLDFGIAKLLGAFEDSPTTTLTGIAPWTPDYASPEQVRAGRITTRTDVYSLGLVLFEILTGERGQRADTSSPRALDRSICEAETPPASERAPRTIARQLAGDLDTIVAKAVHKDPERRYATVGELSDDLGRYLEGRPVRARRPSTWYRTSRFVRRNWLPVGAASVALLGLAAGAVGFAWQARLANRSRVAAEQQRDRAAREHRMADEQRDAAVREQARAESLAREANAQRERANSEAATAKAVSDFLQKDLLAQASSANQASPGRKPDPDLKVRTALDRAAAGIAGKFDRQPAVEAAIRQTMGEAYKDLGLLPEAQKQLERALELRQGIVGGDHPDTLHTLGLLGEVYWMQGQRAEVGLLWNKLLASQRRVLGERNSETLDTMGNLAVLAHAEGRDGEAEALYRRVLDIERAVMGERNEQTLTTMDNLATFYTGTGRYAQSEALLTRTLEARTRALGQDHLTTMQSTNNLATLLASEGKYEQSGALLSKLLESQRRVLGPEHPTTLVGMSNLAKVQALEGMYEAAEALYTRLVEIRRRVLGETHPGTFIVMNNLAAVWRNEGRLAEAEKLENQVLEAERKLLGEDHRETLVARNYLGLIYQRQGRYADAEALFQKLADARRRVLGARHIDTARTLTSLGEVRMQEAKHGDAEAPLREAVAIYESTKSDEWGRYSAASLLGASLAGQRRFAEAEPLLVSGYASLVERRALIPAERHGVVEEAGGRIVHLYEEWGKAEKAAEWRGRAGGGR